MEEREAAAAAVLLHETSGCCSRCCFARSRCSLQLSRSCRKHCSSNSSIAQLLRYEIFKRLPTSCLRLFVAKGAPTNCFTRGPQRGS